MANNSYKLQKIEAISLIIIVMLNKLILNIPFYITSLVGTGAIINIIYVGIIDLIFTLLLVKLFDKFQNSDIVDISEFLGGKPLKWIMAIASILTFFIACFITLSNFASALQIVYFSNFSMIYVLLFFIIAIFVANLSGLRAIIHISSLLAPFTLISIIIPIFGVWKEFSIESFTPIFGHSFYSTFVVGLLNCFSMYIIAYYYYLKPYLKETIEFKKVVLSSYTISWVLLIVTIIPVMTLFNVNTSNEPLNTLYLLSRKIELRSFHSKNGCYFRFTMDSFYISIFEFCTIFNKQNI